MADRPVVAVLGTGIMGYPMAGRLADDGFAVRVWNRTQHRARPLGERGALVADTPAEAVSGTDVVITMLATADAVRETMAGSDGALAATSADAVWLQMSTVGIGDNAELAKLAGSAGVTFVDAPVLGTKQPAEQGKLAVLASGPEAARDRCDRVLDPLSSKVLWVGAAGDGTRLKLVANNWVLALVEASAECVALARTLGLDPQLFLDAIEGTGVDSAYVHIKGKAMIQREFPASFPARLAAKDAGLVLEAGGTAVDLAVARAAYEHMRRSRLGRSSSSIARLTLGISRILRNCLLFFQSLRKSRYSARTATDGAATWRNSACSSSTEIWCR